MESFYRFSVSIDMFILKKRCEVYIAKCSPPFKDMLVMVGIKLL